MKIDIPKGKYVVAVSGGVDSMVLLDLLSKKSGLELIVAHMDHGIRKDSYKDKELVKQKSDEYGMDFVYEQVALGAGASEAVAREVRYDFLKRTFQATGSKAIITAHHEDDVIETAILNMLRGTGRKGLASLNSTEQLVRPLLIYTKKEILNYARKNKLEWNEDSTNQDTNYLRNYVRLKIIPKFSEADRNKLLHSINNLRIINSELDEMLDLKSDKLDRKWFSLLSHKMAREVMASWLRSNNIRDFDSKQIEKLVVAAKVAKAGKQVDVLNKISMKVTTDSLCLM